MNKKYFKLFSNCINVRGYANSLIMDLQKGTWMPIPSLLSDILKDANTNISVTSLKKRYNNLYNNGIDAYFNYFNKQELGFFTNTPKLFSDLNTDYRTPFHLLTSIICIDNYSDFDLKQVIFELIGLGCQSIQIRVKSIIDYNRFFDTLRYFSQSRVKVVELFIEYTSALELFLSTYKEADMRFYVYVLSSNRNQIEQISNLKIVHTKQQLERYPAEIISLNTFTVNMMHYKEALWHNIGLHRKVSIDYDGSIKNYVDHQQIFGSVKKDKLKDIFETDMFKQKWDIMNDKIEKCKDCQFRYMCLSNSDIEIRNNQFYKVKSCLYDPYTDTWKDNN